MITPTPEIRRAFYQRLKDALPVGCVTENDVAWPNVAFNPVADRTYIMPFCLYGETVTVSLGPDGFEKLTGIFQISIYGVLNKGEGEIEELARDFTELFRGGTSIPVEGWNPATIINASRSPLHINTSGEVTRPYIVVSAKWNQHTPKGV